MRRLRSAVAEVIIAPLCILLVVIVFLALFGLGGSIVVLTTLLGMAILAVFFTNYSEKKRKNRKIG